MKNGQKDAVFQVVLTHQGRLYRLANRHGTTQAENTRSFALSRILLRTHTPRDAHDPVVFAVTDL